jgi:hypothetical protein
MTSIEQAVRKAHPGAFAFKYPGLRLWYIMTAKCVVPVTVSGVVFTVIGAGETRSKAWRSV